MKLKSPFILLLCICTNLIAGTKQDTVIVRKNLVGTRIATAPKIDGELNDEQWKNAQIATDFIQNSPKEKAPVSFQTETRIVYDDAAIYIGAMCYDDHPDSIKKQLGTRDDNLNADNFRVVFDTYNTQQDDFDFSVTASGVQSDSRYTDPNFNAVWKSEVKILKNGWSVEMEIPWSAIRFPTSKHQIWGLQFTRNIQRKFEFDQWALTPKDKPNPLQYWGTLTGLDSIDAPVRLILTPYLTTVVDKDNRYGPVNPSASLSGGMGLKYGINESFTLDMTLLPDFSQVKSDNIVKNLSPFEIQYAEQRPFFTEGTDLFQLGGLFYSRRIGEEPVNFYTAPSLADSSEKIIKNPQQSKLLNATKISGRTNNGLGIGVMNAFVANTYAIAKDTITGKTRRILTEPSTNYNIFVFDKQLQNSSHVYVTHTNVIRSHGYRSADVTASGFSFNNKKNTWNINGVGGVSDVLVPIGSLRQFNSSIGYYYDLGINKNSGKVQYGINRQVVNQNWDCNDMGINLVTNYASNNANISYNIFNPWKIFNNASANLSTNYTANEITHGRNSMSIDLFSNATFRNFWSTYFGADYQPVDTKDYYEPRVAGRYYLRTRAKYIYGGINSNPNHKFSYGISFDGGMTAKPGPTIPVDPWGGFGPYISLRVGNRFMFNLSSSYHGDFGDRGWVDTLTDGTIIFGRRILHDFETDLTGSFVFVKDMSISIIARDYWSTGHYLGFYSLNEDGTLKDDPSYNENHDFSFSSFNVDMVYNWIFAPGSTLSVAWKQNILYQGDAINYDYYSTFHTTLVGPQLNQVSVKLLYYLDYNYLRHLNEERK